MWAFGSHREFGAGVPEAETTLAQMKAGSQPGGPTVTCPVREEAEWVETSTSWVE